MNPDKYKHYYNQQHYYDPEAIYESTKIYFRDTIINKLDTLKERIEDWASINGYGNLDNSDESKNTATGELIWRRTDWEYVDDTYITMINDDGFYPGKKCFKKMNVMWKKYK